MSDNVLRLCLAVYGRDGSPSEILGGAGARFLEDAAREIDRLRATLAERERALADLITRRDELLALVRQISMDAIPEAEAIDLRGQIAVLIAEVGLLRTENQRLREGTGSLWSVAQTQEMAKLRATLAEKERQIEGLQAAIMERDYAVNAAESRLAKAHSALAEICESAEIAAGHRRPMDAKWVLNKTRKALAEVVGGGE